MTDTQSDPERFRPRAVSKYFRQDWQFALRIAQFPFLRQASLIIAIVPFLQTILPRLHLHYDNLWVLWLASVAFLIGYGLLQWRIPAFIKHHRDFGQYDQQKHSHRWIVWEFFHAEKYLPRWQTVLEETIFKQLAYSADSLIDFDVCRASPIFPSATGARIESFPPVNANRDIYLPFLVNGRKYILPMQETDPELSNKQREPFWILFSGCASANPKSRRAVWACFAIAATPLMLSVLNNVTHALSGRSLLQILAAIPWCSLRLALWPT